MSPSQAREQLPHAVALTLQLALRAQAPEVPAPIDPADDVIRIEEAAKILGTTTDTLYRKRRRAMPGIGGGHLGYRDPLDGRIKFRRSALLDYMKKIGRRPS